VQEMPRLGREIRRVMVNQAIPSQEATGSERLAERDNAGAPGEPVADNEAVVCNEKTAF